MYTAVSTSSYTPTASAAFVRSKVTVPKSASFTKPVIVPVNVGSFAPAVFWASSTAMTTSAGVTVRLPGTTSIFG